MGSKDRKWISHLCYCRFRAGDAAGQGNEEQAMIRAVFLCATGPNDFLAALSPELNASAGCSVNEKLSLLGISRDGSLVFPLLEHLEPGIDKNAFAFSHLLQPDLFLRARPGRRERTTAKLTEASIPFTEEGDVIRLLNSTAIDGIIELNRDAVVQDLNSQRTGLFLLETIPGLKDMPIKAWDCCAASGGKSIMLKDLLPGVSLTVSDIRETIMVNLRKRFQEAGIQHYRSFVADISKHAPPAAEYDLVLADVPCSGSGTWGRTPEQLRYFDESRISEYAALQRKIAINAASAVKEGGHLFYITCSVFHEENINTVQYIAGTTGMELLATCLFEGYQEKADSLFAAIFRK